MDFPAGVPDIPKLYIRSDGVATWSPVNPRSSSDLTYLLTAETDGLLVGNRTITPSSSGNVTQDLFDEALRLQDGQSYNICVTARNEIGYSMPGCDKYTHTGMYIHVHNIYM